MCRPKQSPYIINGAFDFIIVGGGIAAVSLAYLLSQLGFEVLIIEQTDRVPYHSTARSVALYSKSYAYSASIAAVIAASENFIRTPPSVFSCELIKDRETVHAFNSRDGEKGLSLFNEMGDFAARDQVMLIRNTELCERVPILRKDYAVGAILETGSGDLDPQAMWNGFLRGHKQNGGRLLTNAELKKATYTGGEWKVETETGNYMCRTLVNAAGAWGDEVAKLCGVKPIGLQPFNRTAMACQPAEGQVVPEGMPFVFLPFDELYWRFHAGMATLSPADETPAPPCDAQPDEYDIARAMAKFEEVSILRLAARKPRAWAGQRTFTPDKDPGVGFDAANPGFFWLVGQGGFGIESAWALANIAASLLSGRPLPSEFAAFGLTVDTFSPKRFNALRVA